MSSQNIGNFGKNVGVNFTTFGAGLKRTQLDKNDASQTSIFDAIDKNKDGVIDQNEFNDFKTALDNKEADGTITGKEADNFLKGLRKGGSIGKEIKQEDLLKFLEQYNLATQDIKSVETVEQDGKQVVQVSHNDGSAEFINPDGSMKIVAKNDEGIEVTSSIDKDGKLTEASYIAENNVQVTEKYDDEGHLTTQTVTSETGTEVTEYTQGGENPIPTKTTITETGGKSSTTTILYDDQGKPATGVYKAGINTINFTYDAEGNRKIQSSVENEGIPAKETHSEYTYNEDGTVTVNIKAPDSTTVRTYNEQGQLTCDVITDNNGKVTNRNYLENGAYVDTTETSGGKLSTAYSTDGKCMGKVLERSDGSFVQVEYDGNGNTKAIVQNNESPAAIAKKFGCSLNDLLAANKGAVHGKAPNQYFVVGEEIVIPGKEIEPDSPALKGRKSAEEVEADYVQAQARKAQKEAEAAALDASLREYGLMTYKGKGQKITAKNGKTYTVVGEAQWGRHIAVGSDGKYITIAHDGVILKDSYVADTNFFRKGQKVSGKVKVRQSNGSFKIETRTYAKVADLGKGRIAVIDKNGKGHVISHDGVVLDETYLQRDATADAMSKDSKVAAQFVVQNLGADLKSARAAFDAQMAKDGWAADVADGISYLWAWAGDDKNQAAAVRKDLDFLDGKLRSLQADLKAGNMTAFATNFKKAFGVPYNQQNVAEYYRHPTDANYRKAFGTSRVSDINLRVQKYNQSQDTGASVVRGTTTFVVAGTATVLIPGAGAGIAAGMLTSAAASTVVNATDVASSRAGREAFTNGGDEMWDIVKDRGMEIALDSIPGVAGSFGGKYIGKGMRMAVGKANSFATGAATRGGTSAMARFETGAARVVANVTEGRAGNIIVKGSESLGGELTEGLIESNITSLAQGQGLTMDGINVWSSAANIGTSRFTGKGLQRIMPNTPSTNRVVAHVQDSISSGRANDVISSVAGDVTEGVVVDPSQDFSGIVLDAASENLINNGGINIKSVRHNKQDLPSGIAQVTMQDGKPVKIEDIKFVNGNYKFPDGFEITPGEIAANVGQTITTPSGITITFQPKPKLS